MTQTIRTENWRCTSKYFPDPGRYHEQKRQATNLVCGMWTESGEDHGKYWDPVSTKQEEEAEASSNN